MAKKKTVNVPAKEPAKTPAKKPARKRTQKQDPVSSSDYTDEERRRFLYRTAAEMRVINDKADKRQRNRASREDLEPDESNETFPD